MSIWTQFENQRDELYCGSRWDRPREWTEAEIGAKYELYYAPQDKVEEIIVCTADNKDEIERNLNDPEADLWWYRKVVA